MLNFFLIVHKNFPKISRELQKFPGNCREMRFTGISRDFPGGISRAGFPGRDFPGTSPSHFPSIQQHQSVLLCKPFKIESFICCKVIRYSRVLHECQTHQTKTSFQTKKCKQNVSGFYNIKTFLQHRKKPYGAIWKMEIGFFLDCRYFFCGHLFFFSWLLSGRKKRLISLSIF